MKRKHYKESNLNALNKLAIGTGISLAFLLLFSIIFGAIAMTFQNTTGMIPLFSILTIVFSATFGGIVVSRFISDGKLGFSILVFLMSSLLLMLVGTILGKGSLPLSVFMNFLIYVGTATLSSYLFRKRDRMKRKFSH